MRFFKSIAPASRKAAARFPHQVSSPSLFCTIATLGRVPGLPPEGNKEGRVIRNRFYLLDALRAARRCHHATSCGQPVREWDCGEDADVFEIKHQQESIGAEAAWRDSRLHN